MPPCSDRELVFPPSGGEMAALMRDKRWEATPLGPVEHWSSALGASVRTMLTSRCSMWLGWGDPLTFLYNDACRAGMLGTRHPWALGAPASEVWSELWSELGPRIACVLTDGRATQVQERLLVLERNGGREETYQTFSCSPLHEDDGRVRGVLCVATEDTGRVISERRLGLLGKLAAQTAGIKTGADLLAGIERGLASGARDLPFTLTYLFDADGRTARLVAQTGFGAGAAGVARVIDLDAPSPWSLRQIAQAGGAVEVELAAEIWPTGPWSTAPSHASVVPIPRQGQARPAGAFVAGLSPHRVFDAAYREFVGLLAGQIAAGLAGAEVCEADVRRAEGVA
ncbi:MAG TPA: PAS domain-containing protein, partial [Kofleriaceae bacterium]